MTSAEPAQIPPSGIASAVERLNSLRAEAQLVAAEIKKHVDDHETKAKAHLAEAAAGKKLLGAPSETGEFVLTRPPLKRGVSQLLADHPRVAAFAFFALLFYIGVKLI